MRAWSVIISLLVPCIFIGDSAATSLGAKQLDIEQMLDAPAGCLPTDESESIKLESADVIEDSRQVGGLPHQWAIEKIPGAQSTILRPGECVVFGKPIDGYQQIGEITPLEEGKTYSFGLRRGDRLNDWVSRLYVGMFCVQRSTDGRLAYLPYVRHPDGTVTYPPCGRYIGSPAAPDGINPPRPPGSLPIDARP